MLPFQMQSSCPFIFAISLQPRIVSKEWQAGERNLHHTLHSIRGSRGASPLTVIACHDKPDLGIGYEDVAVLRVPFEP
jgi:hypothetical protein